MTIQIPWRYSQFLCLQPITTTVRVISIHKHNNSATEAKIKLESNVRKKLSHDHLFERRLKIHVQKGEETTTTNSATTTTTVTINNRNKCRDEEEVAEDEEEGEDEDQDQDQGEDEDQGEDVDKGGLMKRHRVSQGLRSMRIIMKAQRVRMRQSVVKNIMKKQNVKKRQNVRKRPNVRKSQSVRKSQNAMKIQSVRKKVKTKSRRQARPIGHHRPGRATVFHGFGGCFRFCYGRDGAIMSLCPADDVSTAATRKCMRIQMPNKLRLSRSQSTAFVCVCWHLGTKGREIPMQCDGGEGGKGRRTTDDGVGTCDEDTLKHEAGCGKFESSSSPG